MSRRIKALGPPTARSKSYLREYAEHGYGMSITDFNSKHGYGKVAHKRWCSDIDGFREKFEALKFSHENRRNAIGPEPKVLPPSHTENLTIWQQNFLESWRRGKKKLDACAKAGVAWKEVRHSLDIDDDFRQAFNDTREELLIGLEDELMVKGYEGISGAIDKLIRMNEGKVKDAEELDPDWWEDMTGIAESLA